MQAKEHWQRVYTSKASDTVSWYLAHAETSLRLINAANVASSATIIDVGGGASTLVADLIAAGYTDLTVLDLSAAALAVASERLGSRGHGVRWLEADILHADLAARAFDVWHDRAVFHFLTASEDRRSYIDTVLRVVKTGGSVIIATFADDGPSQCSGLPVMRYRAETLYAEFGDRFELLRHEKELHRTPAGHQQAFLYCHFRKID